MMTFVRTQKLLNTFMRHLDTTKSFMTAVSMYMCKYEVWL